MPSGYLGPCPQWKRRVVLGRSEGLLSKNMASVMILEMAVSDCLSPPLMNMKPLRVMMNKVGAGSKGMNMIIIAVVAHLSATFFP